MIAFTALSISAVLLASCTTSVSAHGFLQSVTIRGKAYPAWDPFVDPYANPVPARVTRVVPDDGPVTDLNDPSMVCNKGGNKGAGLVVEAAAGSQITFTENRWPDDHKGPISHYMTACANNDCKNFDPTRALWFKVDAVGLNNGVWASDTFIKNGNSFTMTIPADLKPGEYLVRHELIALHSSPSQIQVYPECAQVKVTGSGNMYPSGSALVKITDLYSGYEWPDIWADNFKAFTIPGPKPAFGSNGDSSNVATKTPANPSPSASASHFSGSQHTAIASSSAISSEAAIPSKSGSSSQAAPTTQCRSRKSRRFEQHAAMRAKRHH